MIIFLGEIPLKKKEIAKLMSAVNNIPALIINDKFEME